MTVAPELRICALYPELLNIYADRGNLLMLQRRCAWRGISVRISRVGLGDRLAPEDHDLFYLGGGQDRDQERCALDLAGDKRDALHEAARQGRVILGICGGFQLLGTSYRMGDRMLPGVGLVDALTVREEGPRLVGNVAIEVDTGDGPRQLAGFENHGGRTYLGERETPLGHVLHGHGNNGADRGEGVRGANVIGTYLHGPLLPKNSWFADWLIRLALGMEALPALDDRLEENVHGHACRAAAAVTETD